MRTCQSSRACAAGFARAQREAVASVPFEFDVHAIIPSDDAPTLENELHTAFDDLRINHVNLRKEFFRVPLDRVRKIVADRGKSHSSRPVLKPASSASQSAS